MWQFHDTRYGARALLYNDRLSICDREEAPVANDYPGGTIVRCMTGFILPAAGEELSHPVSAAGSPRCVRITPLALAFLAALAPATISQALESKPLPLQLQKQPISVTLKQQLFLAPKITKVTPQTCVRAGLGAKLGAEVTLGGSNFGSPKPAGYTLAVQPAGGNVKAITERSWSSTSITFNVPAGLAAGSTFTAGILSGGGFVASSKLTVCAKTRTINARAATLAREQVLPDAGLQIRSPALRQFKAASPPSDPGGGPPEITSVSPAACVTVGKTATAFGVNLGTSKLAAGFSLGYQALYEPPTREIAESTWSPTSVSFIVPAEAGAGGWFALGIIYEAIFYAQQYVMICGANTGQSGNYGGDYDYQDSWGSAATPKGARVLGRGAVDIQIESSPVPAETAPSQPSQPSQPGRPVVGGKLLAMKALAGRGLRKVNRECDLFDPHCPCCRKDDSVCLEKESDDENGSSVWVVSWKSGAKTADGQGVYDAHAAEDDVEAVTRLQCDSVAGGDAGSAGGAKLNCR